MSWLICNVVVMHSSRSDSEQADACRAITHANKCLLFEPNSASSRKFLDILVGRLRQENAPRQEHAQSDEDIPFPVEEEKPPPFELEVLEAALMVATGDDHPCMTCKYPFCY